MNTNISTITNVLDRLQFRQVYVQGDVHILASCDTPMAINTFNHKGHSLPLPHSCLIQLEYRLHSDNCESRDKGMYTVCTGYDDGITNPSGMTTFVPTIEMVMHGQYLHAQSIAVNILKSVMAVSDGYEFRFINYMQTFKPNIRDKTFDPSVIQPMLKPNRVTFVEYIPGCRWDARITSKVYIGDNASDPVMTIYEHMSEPSKLLHAFLTFDHGNMTERMYTLFSKERVDDELFRLIKLRSSRATDTSSIVINTRMSTYNNSID